MPIKVDVDDCFDSGSEVTSTTASTPGTKDYLFAVYASYGNTINDANLAPLLDSSGKDVESTDDLDGFHAQAFVDTATNSIVVAFEGTVFSLDIFDTDEFLYGVGTADDDLKIVEGKLPRQLVDDAVNFIGYYVEPISNGKRIYVTGHSLGGLEAEAVADELPVSVSGGTTFGAPELPGYLGATSNANASDFDDYIDYGDPVGNYPEPGGAYQHYGSVLDVGSKSDSPSAAVFDELISNPSIFGTFDAFFKYHQLSHYADDLAIDLGEQSTGPSSGSVEVGISDGSISVDYTASTSNGQTTYSRIGDPSISLSLSWDGLGVDVSVPVVVPVATTSTSGTYSWSDLFAWSADYVALDGSVDLLNFINGVESGPSLAALSGTIQSLLQAGPTAQTVSIDLSSLVGLDGLPIAVSASLALAYDVEIAAGVTIVMDQPSVVLDALAIDFGGSLSAGSGFSVATNLSNEGDLDVVSGGGPNVVSGNLFNDGEATIDGPLTVDDGVFNDGSLTLTTNASLSGEAYLVNDDVLYDTGSFSAPQTTFNDGGVLEVADGGNLSIDGDVYGGTVEALDDGVVEVSLGAAFVGVTVDTLMGGAIDVNAGATLALTGVVDNWGAITLEGDDYYYANEPSTLQIASSGVTLDGGGKVTLSGEFNNFVVSDGSPAMLTNVDDTIEGGGTIGDKYLTLINEAAGVIDANGGELTLDSGSHRIANTGMLDATGGGILAISGAVSNAARGVIEANGGSVYLEGTVVNSRTAVVEAMNSGEVELEGGTIDGGTLITSKGATIGVDSGEIETAVVTKGGNVVVNAGGTLTLAGVIRNLGTIALNGYYNNGAYLSTVQIASGGVTLQGGGQVALSNANGGYNDIVSGGSAATLTNVDDTIEGAGTIGDQYLTLTNEASGVIDADNSSLTLNTGSNAIANAGLLEATAGGTLTINSAVDNAATGMVEANGGTVYVESVVGGGSLTTVNGGAIDVFGGAVENAKITAGSQVTVTGGETLTLAGVIDNAGVIALDGYWNLGAYLSTLQIASGGMTLQGGGQVALSNANGGYNDIVSGGSAATLTNVDDTIEGAGTIGDQYLTLTNEASGVIDADNSSLTLNTGSNAIANAGLLEATAGGTLTINSAVDNAATGMVEANGGTVYVESVVGGGSLTTVNGGAIDVFGGAVENAKITAGSQVTVTGGETLTLAGVIDNAGVIALDGYWNLGAYLSTLQIASGGMTLQGGGQVALSNANGGYNDIVSGGSAATLTNVDDTIEGAGTIGDQYLTLTNEASGVIDANAGELTLDTGQNTIVNDGTLEATASGTLTINSAVDNAATGVVEANGGTVSIAGAINNATTGLIESTNGGYVEFDGGTVVGGSLITTDTATIDISAGTIENSTVSNAGNVAVYGGGTLTLAGTINNAGVIALDGYYNLGGYLSTVQIDSGGVTLQGGGQVSLSSSGDNYIVGDGSAATLTNVDNTIEGSGTIGDPYLTLVNEASGVIDADNGSLTLNTGSNAIANAGLLEATTAGGGLTVDSAVDNAATGMVEANGGTVYIESAVVGGSLITANGGGIYIYGGAIESATITAGSVVTVIGGETATLAGTIDNAGGIALEGYYNLGAYLSTVQIASGGATLQGGGQVALSDASGGYNDIVSGGASATLTNVDDTIEGAGTIGDKYLTLINDASGVVDASGGELTLDTSSHAIANTGMLDATGGGILAISAAVSNAARGVIEANGGTVYVEGTVVNSRTAVVGAMNSGEVELEGGTIDGGTLITSKGATIGVDSGKIETAAVSKGSNVAVNAGGTLTLEGVIRNLGAITLEGRSYGSKLQIDSGGVTLGGGGQVTLSGEFNNFIVSDGSTATLTNVDDTIQGGGTIGDKYLTLINEASGFIDANAGELTLDTGSNTIANVGLLEATGGGILAISSAVVNAPTGIIEANGGTVYVEGTVVGGALITANKGAMYVYGGIQGVTIAASSDVSVLAGATLTLAGVIDNLGAITLGGDDVLSTLQIDSGGAMLEGGGQVTLSGPYYDNSIVSDGSAATLTNVDDTIQGGGTIGDKYLTLINEASGFIDANAGELTLDTGSNTIANVGLLEATGGGILAISSAVVNAPTGIIEANGGTVYVEGTVVGGALITANKGAMYVYGGIQGVTIAASSDVSVLAGATLTLAGVIDNLGAITLGGDDVLSTLQIDSGGAMLEGGGQVTLSGPYYDNSIVSDGSAATLTNVDDTIQGGGTIGDKYLTLINEASGVVDANAGELTLGTGSHTIANSGLLEATGGGGILNISSAVSNAATGVIEANGDTVYIESRVSGGTFIATNGTIESDGGAIKSALVSDNGSLIVDSGYILTLSGVSTLSGTIAGSGGLWLAGGATTIGAGATMSISSLSISASATKVIIDENLTYDEALTVKQGSTLTIAADDTLTLGGSMFIAGTLAGAGTLAFAAGAATIASGANLSVSNWSISGATTRLTESLSYAGTFGEQAGSTVSVASGDSLTLTGQSSFSGAVRGLGTLILAGGSASFAVGAAVSVADWSITGTGKAAIGENLSYGGTFFAGQPTAITVAAGDALTLTGSSLLQGMIGGGALALRGGSTTISFGAALSVANWSISGLSTRIVLAKSLGYAGSFSEASGSLTLSTGDTLALKGTSSLAGLITGAGTLALAGGSTTIASNAAFTIAHWSLTGAGTSATLGKNLKYSGSFTQGASSTFDISTGDTLNLVGSNRLSGTIGGTGTFVLGGGATTLSGGAALTVSNWSIFGPSTAVAVGRNLTYAGAYTQSSGATLSLTGGFLDLTASASFDGGTVNGANHLITLGTTAISGLTIGGTAIWSNGGNVGQKGNVTVGDAIGAEAILVNRTTGIYDITSNSGIERGASAASYIENLGQFAKTGGKGVSVIAPNMVNSGTIAVSSGALQLQGALSGTGKDQIDGFATLQVLGTVGSGQTFVYSGSGGDLVLDDLSLGALQPFHGSISGFGAGDKVDAGVPFGSGTTFVYTENAAKTAGVLALTDGTKHASIAFLGDYATSNFTPTTDSHGGTLFTFHA